MRLREFARAGHWPTLACAFLYFDLSFMLWMLLGALGVFISQEFGLSPSAKGFLVAVPILSGAVLRPVMGVASDRWGAKRIAMIGMACTALPLVWGGWAMNRFADGLGVGALLGVAGASFAVALPLASRWYPAAYQGLAMGIAGAGNSGTVLAALFAPQLAEHWGWRGVFQLALIPLLLVFCCFTLCARDNPTATSRRVAYADVFRQRDLWRLNLFYMITFGGFVGLASFLPIFFCDQYGCSRVAAGTYAALCVCAGSVLRPLGGALADRFGGVRVLRVLFVVVVALVTLLARLPALPFALTLLVMTTATLGMGNGAVFQLVGRRFRDVVGVATGIVGACGGIGGFFLPSSLGLIKEIAGSYGLGFALFAMAATAATIVLGIAQREWQRAGLGRPDQVGWQDASFVLISGRPPGR